MSNEHETTCTDCGVKITGVPVVPSTGEGPTRAQIEKLKPTVYLCVECARERGLSFDQLAIGTGTEDPPPDP
ncbi:MAG: hypothetical protein JSW71_03290 [Gemmatimonadota bacterium]|nr:MAG: hypothetical protein JSW71_03290 [Gemmatimonadota bacterium]